MDPIAQLQAQIADLMNKVNILMEYKEAREEQQISYPLDDASRNTLRAFTRFGPGSKTTTRSQSIGSTPTSITVPVNPTGTVIIEAEGAQFEVPYL